MNEGFGEHSRCAYGKDSQEAVEICKRIIEKKLEKG